MRQWIRSIKSLGNKQRSIKVKVPLQNTWRETPKRIYLHNFRNGPRSISRLLWKVRLDLLQNTEKFKVTSFSANSILRGNHSCEGPVYNKIRVNVGFTVLQVSRSTLLLQAIKVKMVCLIAEIDALVRNLIHHP